MLFSAEAGAATTSPSGPTTRITSTETGSLNVSVNTFGISANMAPSAGSARTSDACAKASDDERSAAMSAAMTAKRRTSALRQQSQARRGLRAAFALCAMAPVLRDLDPAMDALLAFLHDREIDGLAGLELFREHAREHELVVVGVGQLAARP